MDDSVSKRKNVVLMNMNATLKRIQGVSEQVKMDIRAEVKNMPRLGFYNGPLLAIGMVMYNSGITIDGVKQQPQLLDSYATYLTLGSNNSNIDGIKNDILRYLIIVVDYYFNIDAMNNMLDVYVEREEVQFDDYD